MPRWAVGVTSVDERARTLLPKTLLSLRKAGFDDPRLFIDGVQRNPLEDQGWTLESTCRWPNIRTWGNWLLGLTELLVRNPSAERFGMFQDDLVACLNVRQYLDACPWPCQGYLNLYTFASNQSLAPKRGPGSPGCWFEARERDSSRTLDCGRKMQTGRGAVGLCFTRQAVVDLLGSKTVAEKCLDPHRGWNKVDGCVVDAMNLAGWREWVHDPSLLQHVGFKTTMGSQPHLQATSFMGEDFDAMQLLKKK